jgi:large subunit ribosomal protein L25
MSKNYALTAEIRERTGKGAARALRRENKIPAVIYGDNKNPIIISIPSKETTMEHQKGTMYTTLCNVTVDKDEHLVLARDVQLHPVTDVIEHVDFLRVTPKTKINVNVPVQFINENQSPGLQEKGILGVVRFDVELICSATKIPDFIEVDLTPFAIGDAIKLSDAVLPEGAVPAIEDRDFTLATISAPRTIAEPTEEEGEEVSEGEEAEASESDSEESSEGEASE